MAIVSAFQASAFCLLTSALAPITHGSPTCHAIAITFDLCPVTTGPGFDAPLVQYLIDHKIHATFFPSGAWIAKHDAALRSLMAQPFFEIGTHGEEHIKLEGRPAGVQTTEIEGPVATLRRTYGLKAVFFRPPYGSFDDTTVAAAAGLGQSTVTWSVVSGDPDPKLDPARITEEVVRRAKNGSIIIFHANGRGWHTAEILPEIDRQLLHVKGFASATLSELLRPCMAPLR